MAFRARGGYNTRMNSAFQRCEAYKTNIIIAFQRCGGYNTKKNRLPNVEKPINVICVPPLFRRLHKCI